jgi:ABC-type phosphate transport system substrate-binding protein
MSQQGANRPGRLHLFKSAGALSLIGIAAAISPPSVSAATTPLYAGGVTLSGIAYRNIFNAYGATASGDLCVGLTLCPTKPYRSDVEILYVAVTSTNTAKAFDNYNPGLFTTGDKIPEDPPVASSRDFGPFYGTGTGAGWVPSGTATNYFPKVSFTSGDPMAATDVATATALGYGPPLQVPSLSYSVVITVTPTPVWTPKNAIPVGGSSGIDLSTNSLCGIFTGAITNWNSPELKAANRGSALGSGPITVVYRHDGAATTFLLANALLNQCGTTSHPVSTHPVPDQWLADQAAAIPNTPPYKTNTSFFINVFNAGHLPPNFYNNSAFAGVVGGTVTITGMQEATDATPGAVGYLSTDYAPPTVTGNDPRGNPIAAAANIQSYASYAAGAAARYFPPSSAHTNYIMADKIPPSFVGGASAPAASAINWSVLNPTPTNANAYPIGGFAYFELYSCYASPTDLDALVGVTPKKLGLIRWYFGTESEDGYIPRSTLLSEGFYPVPQSWRNAANTLLTTNIYTKVGTPMQKNTACANIAKGA